MWNGIGFNSSPLSTKMQHESFSKALDIWAFGNTNCIRFNGGAKVGLDNVTTEDCAPSKVYRNISIWNWIQDKTL